MKSKYIKIFMIFAVVFAMVAGLFVTPTFANAEEQSLTATEQYDVDSITQSIPDTAIISFPVPYQSVYEENKIDWSVQEDQDVIAYDKDAHWMVVNRPTDAEATVSLHLIINDKKVKEFLVTVPAGVTAVPSYKVTLNYGYNELSKNFTYKLGEATKVLEIPLRDNYKFDGWYTTEDYQGQPVEKILVGSMENITLYAKWTELAVDSITLDTTIVKKDYKGGEALSTDGLKITAHWNDGSESTVESGFECDVKVINWKDEGRVTVTVTYQGKTASYEVNVTKNENSISDLTIQGWTYGDEANEPSATASFGTISYVYSNIEDGEYSATVPTIAGTYYVKAVVEESQNYVGATSEPVSFTIAKKDLTLTPEDKSISISSVNQLVWEFTSNDFVDGDSLTEEVLANLVVEYYQNNQKVDSLVAGQSYVVKFSGLEMSNYNITIEDANLNINTEQLYFVYTNLTDLVYDNTNKMFTVQAYAEAGETDILITDATPVITYQGNTFTGATSAGEYEVTVSINSSYGELTENVTFVINQATIDLSGVTLTGDTVSYTGQNQMIEAQNLPENDKLVVSYNYEEVVDAGTYEVVVTFSSNDNNYKVSVDSLSATLVIEQAENSATVLLEGWTFGQVANTPSVDATFGGNTVVYTYATLQEGEYTVTIPTNAGTYYVKATIPATDNYASAEDISSFTIAQATIDLSGVTLTGDTVSYTGQNQMISAQNLPENDKLVVSYNYEEVVDAGTYEVVVTFSSNDNNYKVSVDNLSATLVIEQAENSATVSLEGWTFGQVANTPSVTASFGGNTVVYTYATSQEGEYTETIPTNAGTYYVKATIPVTANYAGAEAISQFTIAKLSLTNADVTITVEGSDWNAQNVETLTPSVIVKHGETVIESYDTLVYTYDDESTKVGTATITITLNGNYEGTLTVPFEVTEYGQAYEDAQSLPESIDETYLTLTQNTLPVQLGNSETKSSVLWTSSYTGLTVNHTTGAVTLNKVGLTENTEVTLTAVVSYGTTSAYVVKYTVTLTPNPATEDITDGNVTIFDAPYGYDVVANEVTDETEMGNYTTAVEGEEGYEYLTSYNISLKNELGQSSQPNGTVKVIIKGEFDASKSYVVYYYNGSAITETISATVAQDGSYIEFETDHFSVYIIAVEEEVHVHTPAEPVEDARVESTCTVAGHYYSVIKCSECGEEISRTKVDLELAAHTEEVVKGYDATCTENGLTDGKKCSVCNTVIVEQAVTPAKKHAYGEVSYTWAEDNKSITATRTCQNDQNHVETETVETKYEIVTEATCTTKGAGKYSSQFTNAAFELQTKEVEVPTLEHEYTSVVVTDPTCTDDGYTTHTCSCGDSYKDSIIPAGHIHENDENICDRCGYIKTQSWNLVTDVNDLNIGDQIVIAASDSNVALSTNQKDNNRGAAAVSKANNTVTFGSDVQVITLMAGANANTWAFNVGNGYLYAASSSANHLKTESTLSANSSWEVEISTSDVATIKSTGKYTRNWMRYNSSSSLFACYESGQQDISIYKNIVVYKDPTQISKYTVTFEVDGNIKYTYTVNEGEKVGQPDDPLKDDHTFVCWMNGDSEFDFNTPIYSDIELVAKFESNNQSSDEQTVLDNVTLSFADKAQRTSFSSEKQVWEQNGITFTNEKSSSSNAVADYAKPVRLYQNSKIIISGKGITKIMFDCNSSSHATALKNSIGTVSGVTVTVNADKVTVELNSAVDSFTIANLTAQVRLDSITVNPKQ